jgi:hypothetical protein
MSNRKNLIMLRPNMALLTECNALLTPANYKHDTPDGVKQLAFLSLSRLHLSRSGFCVD